MKKQRQVQTYSTIMAAFGHLYRVQNGILVHSGGLKDGQEATGSKATNQGHRQLQYSKDGVFYRVYVHQLLFAMVHGWLPSKNDPNGQTCVDHIDGSVDRNHISNLRPATSRQNQLNSYSNRGSASPYKGVFWCQGARKWRAMFGKTYLGSFEDQWAAALAYDRIVRADPDAEFARYNDPQLGERSAVRPSEKKKKRKPASGPPAGVTGMITLNETFVFVSRGYGTVSPRV